MDKTALLYEMANSGSYYFRVVRCNGKSLLLSTLEAFFGIKGSVESNSWKRTDGGTPCCISIT